MAKRRATKSAKPKKKTSKKDSGIKKHLIKIVLGLSILILVVTGAAILTHYMLHRKPPEKKPPARIPPVTIPTYEIYPEEEVVPPPPVVKPKPIPGRPLPEVAIIVDDIGYDERLAEKFIQMDSSLTFSILPYGPFSRKILRIAGEKGFETMLHLPMEPKEYPKIKPGPGALLTCMSPDTLIEQLEADLAAVPDIKGVNNHMGSRMTTNSTQMYQIFSILKKRGLYFVDSKTTPDSICEPSARLFQVPFAERDVFIDHIQDKEFIRKQIRLLIHIAEKYGSSIGIAHPHEVTYEVLKDMMPELKKRVKIVPVSKLVEKPA